MVRRFSIFMAAMSAFLVALPVYAEPMPRLAGSGSSATLLVNDRPFLLIGGELSNSAASDPTQLQRHWQDFQKLNMNSVLAPVAWEMIEPREGEFDFRVVDALLQQARAADMRVVLLWFGSWKNSMSSYAPAWAKADQNRFERTTDKNGVSQEMFSAFDPDALKADARAYGRLMRHLKQVDGDARTVIMVQVENEIAMLSRAREANAVANGAFAGPVPAELLRYMDRNRDRLDPHIYARWQRSGFKMKGSWAELFGADDAADEIFQAWHYAKFTDAVAAAGKAEYPLPMFVNAALNRPGARPGEYPSAGPLPFLMDIWKAAAPSIDMLSPDVYFPDFSARIAPYERYDNVLFVPEANRANRPEAAADAFHTFATHDAIGFSPFAIDENAHPSLGKAYTVIRQLSPFIVAARGTGKMHGFRAAVSYDGIASLTPQTVRIDDIAISVTMVDPWMPKDQQNVAAHGGMIIQIAKDEYLLAGSGITATFAPSSGKGLIGLESVWEGEFAAGEWKPGRLLNGDQTHQGRHVRLPPGDFGVQRIRLYRYK